MVQGSGGVGSRRAMAAASGSRKVSTKKHKCGICYEMRSTLLHSKGCGHWACRSCWDKWLVTQGMKVCFQCRARTTKKDLQELVVTEK